MTKYLVSGFEKLIRTFYILGFSFSQFTERYPEHRVPMVDCLVVDVIGKEHGNVYQRTRLYAGCRYNTVRKHHVHSIST